jgi:phosphatidylglycerophosphatase A
MFDRIAKLLATFFYIGDIPFAPGSCASFVSLLIAIILADNPIIYILFTTLIVFIGFVVSGPVERIVKEDDPSLIVIDEVAGMLVALFLLPISIPVLWTGFFLFRAFDMFKIYPVNKFDNKKGAFGIMSDDLVAGIYTNLTLQIAIRLAYFIK